MSVTRPWPGNRSRPRFVVLCWRAGLLMVPRVFRASVGPAAVCAGGRRPAREPSALRASLGASPRSPARPRHRPPAPRQIPPAPSAPAALGVLTCGSVRWVEAWLWLSISNFARNSSMAHSNFEFIALELQRFWGVSKNDHDKLRAKCGRRWCRRRPWVPQPGPSPTGAAVRSCVWRYARGSGPFPPSVGVLQH